MSNHSPGPWFVGAQNDALFVIDRPPQHFTDNPLPEGGLTITIAAVAMLKHPLAEANARLIAAAPEMLDFIETLENDDGKIPEWLWKRRNELIRKARDGE